MKKFCLDNTRIQIVEGKVDPFPGKWPTRWAIRLRYPVMVGGKREFRMLEYFGKPNPLVAAKVTEIVTRTRWRGGEYKIQELDRRGILQYSVGRFPSEEFNSGLPHVTRGSMVSARFNFYNTFLEEPGILGWIFGPLYAKRIKYGPRVLVIYSHFKTLSSDSLEGYKQYITDRRLL